MTSNEHKLARALVEAHVAPEVAPIVLGAVDGWAQVVQEAKDALEQQRRTESDLNRYYTVRELRTLLKLSDSGVRALIDSGVLASTRVGGAIRVPIADVERYLDEHTSRPEQTPKPRAMRPRRSAEESEVLRRWPGLAS